MRNLTIAVASLSIMGLSLSGGAAELKGKVNAVGLRSAENIAVYIDSVPGKTFAPPAAHVTVDQSHLAFAPHVVVIQQGTTVEFKNEDEALAFRAADRIQDLAKRGEIA